MSDTLDQFAVRDKNETYRTNTMQTLEKVAHITHNRQLRCDTFDFGQLQNEFILIGQQIDVFLVVGVLLEQLDLRFGGYHFLQQLNILQRQLLQIQIIDRFCYVLDAHVQFSA